MSKKKCENCEYFNNDYSMCLFEGSKCPFEFEEEMNLPL